ncbi:hypothetical protein [Paenibacillus luteus]|uniref:hypothetical protein n=1 Tax=Paenibacillus luteus TaxID=2545753 RepID=UPI0011434D12|nr:hypothetical protein [Paenibacillus luteus]
MLTENDVISAACSKIEELGFDIVQSLHTSAKGIDIIACKNEVTLYVEAKGETSASLTSSRYGKPFNANQIDSHISRALLTTAKLIQQKQGELFKVAIALPDNDSHRKVINQIRAVLEKLGIVMIWVKSNESVTLDYYSDNTF